jgi:non-ribosomal peptide synthetase component F
MLLESGWEGKSDLRILCGGEALTPDLARQLLPRCRELWNMYGPTETTIWSSVDRVTLPIRSRSARPSPIRSFMFSMRIRKPVAPGMPGTLDWRLGPGSRVSQAPGADRREVREDPARKRTFDARLYRTGDEVRYRPTELWSFWDGSTTR